MLHSLFTVCVEDVFCLRESDVKTVEKREATRKRPRGSNNHRSRILMEGHAFEPSGTLGRTDASQNRKFGIMRGMRPVTHTTRRDGFDEADFR